jgi:hypothetical protein
MQHSFHPQAVSPHLQSNKFLVPGFAFLVRDAHLVDRNPRGDYRGPAANKSLEVVDKISPGIPAGLASDLPRLAENQRKQNSSARGNREQNRNSLFLQFGHHFPQESKWLEVGHHDLVKKRRDRIRSSDPINNTSYERHPLRRSLDLSTPYLGRHSPYDISQGFASCLRRSRSANFETRPFSSQSSCGVRRDRKANSLTSPGHLAKLKVRYTFGQAHLDVGFLRLIGSQQPETQRTKLESFFSIDPLPVASPQENIMAPSLSSAAMQGLYCL